MMDFLYALNDQLTVFLESWGYLGLFLGAALAASIVPFPSELLFVFCVKQLDPVLCVLVATVGNTLGGITLYLMGMLGSLDWIEKHTRIDKNRVRRIRYWLRHRGAPMAIFSFLPAIGQCIVLALGLLRCSLPATTVFMFIGKGFRYVVVALATLSII